MKRTVITTIAVCVLTVFVGPGMADEFLFDANFTYLPAEGEQELPAVAFDGTNHLVVWRNHDGTGYDVLGARVSGDGEVLDTAFIAVAADTGHQQDPDVAHDGTNWLVVWQDAPNGNQIRGARVGPDGTVLDPGGFPILAGGGREDPAVAFDGTNYMVVWADISGGNRDIYGARVTPGGAVLDTAGIAICTAGNHQDKPALAFDGSNWLVAWGHFVSGQGYDLYGGRVTAGGEVLDDSGFALSTATNRQNGAAVAFDGTNWLVAWEDMRNGYNSDVFATRVTQGGVVLDPDGIAVSAPNVGEQWPAKVAFDGTDYLVVWADQYQFDIFGMRVSTDGTVQDTVGFRISNSAYSHSALMPAVVFNGTNFFVAWQYKYPRHHDIHCARVTPDATVLDPTGIVVTRGDPVAYEAYYPAVASDGTDYLAVWTDYRSDGVADIFGARVSRAGTVLDPASMAISFAEEDQDYPSAAFGGSNYLVAWEDERDGGSEDIYGARVGADGGLLDPDGIAMSMADRVQEDAQVSFDGTNFLVVWQDYRNTNSDVYCARLTPGGSVLDTAGIQVAGGDATAEDASVAFGGTNYLVVWEDYRGDDADIYAARVTPGGAVLDPTGFAVAVAAEDQSYPSVAFDGTNYLVAWHDRRGGTDNDIYAARVSPAGAVLDPNGIEVCSATENQEYTGIVFDGGDYLLAWEDYRNDPDTSDIYGARVSTSGSVLDRFPVSVQANWQYEPVMARGGGSQVLCVFTGWVGEHQGRTYEAERTWGTLDLSGGVVEERTKSQVRRTSQTIVRGMLVLPRDMTDFQPGKSYRVPRPALLDITGRKVMDLKPGENDIRHVAPGVYFITPHPSPLPQGEREWRQAVLKVVVQK